MIQCVLFKEDLDVARYDLRSLPFSLHRLRSPVLFIRPHLSSLTSRPREKEDGRGDGDESEDESEAPGSGTASEVGSFGLR